MESKHIAFVSFPHPPEVNPTIPIVSVLVRRGYRVSYVTSEAFGSRIEATGAKVLHCPSFDPASIFDPSHQKEIDVRNPIFELADQTVAAVRAYFLEDRPDLFLYDVLALAGREMAGRWDIPAIQTNPLFALDPERLPEQIPDADFRMQEIEFSRAAATHLADRGIVSSGLPFHREKLNIHLFPEALQLPGDVFGSQFFYAGRCAAEQPHYGTWQMPARTRPRVFISNSTTYTRGPEFFRLCIDALSGQGLQIVLATGEKMDSAVLHPLPADVSTVRRIAHVKLLPFMDAFVFPGGIVSQAEAAYHGVPLVAISHGYRELEWVGENVRRLGTGRHLRQQELSVNGLREAVLGVLEDRKVHDTVRELRHLVTRAPGGEETANRIEEFLKFEC